MATESEFSSTSDILLQLNNPENPYSKDNISNTQQSTTDALQQNPDPNQQYNLASSQTSEFERIYNKIFKDATSQNPDPNATQEATDLHSKIGEYLGNNQPFLSQQDADSNENNLDQFGKSTSMSLQKILNDLFKDTNPITFQSNVQEFQNQFQNMAGVSPSADQTNAPSFKPGGGSL